MDGLVPGFKTSDGSKASIDMSASSFVELKTSRLVEHPGQARTLKRFKMVKWWSQSYAVGIAEVVAGMRDDDGRVVELQR